jgi:hypothetical protein
MQPWTFVAISDAGVKARIREAAEKEERASYGGRMSEEWLRALAPLGTDWRKPFLETAPWLVVLFAQKYGIDADGNRDGNVEKDEREKRERRDDQCHEFPPPAATASAFS